MSRRAESDPACARDKNLCRCVGRSRITRSEALLIGIVEIARMFLLCSRGAATRPPRRRTSSPPELGGLRRQHPQTKNGGACSPFTPVIILYASARPAPTPHRAPDRPAGAARLGGNIGRVTYPCVSSFYNTTLSAVLSSLEAIIMFPKALSPQNGNRSKAWLRPS
jgi:hypothetical protein